MSIPKLIEVRNLFDWFCNLTTRNAIILLLFFGLTWQYFQIKELKKEITDLQIIKKDNILLEKRLNAISSEIVIFKASTDRFPFPYWIKDLNGKVIYVNEAFVNKYLRTRGLTYSDYVGHYDITIFSVSDSELYQKNDSLVIAVKRPMNFVERVGKTIVRTAKFPYELNGVVVGIAGVEYANF